MSTPAENAYAILRMAAWHEGVIAKARDMQRVVPEYHIRAGFEAEWKAGYDGKPLA